MAENPRDPRSGSPGTYPERGGPERGAPQRGLSKRMRFIIPIGLLVLAAIAAVAYWYTYRRGYVSTNDAYIDANPVTISSKVLGRIIQLAVGTGDAAKEGQLLVQLDDSDSKAQEAQATAALAYTEQTVSLARIGLDRAQDDFQRAQVQYKDNVIPREQYDHTRQALEMAEAQYKVALSQVNTSKAQLGVISTQLENMQIMSPVSGVVAKKWVMPGEIVQPGQPIFTIYDLNNVWITANFEETKLAAIDANDQVRISVDAYPGRAFTGKVVLIGAAAASQFSLIPPNNASGNFTKVTQRVPVKISIESSGMASSQISLLPGMSAVVKISVKSE